MQIVNPSQAVNIEPVGAAREHVRVRRARQIYEQRPEKKKRKKRRNK